jgi:hypothetical protein
MKILLVLCIILEATVSAKTALFVTLDYIAERRTTVAKNPLSELSELDIHIEEVNLRVENILLTSKLILKLVDSPYSFNDTELLKQPEKNILWQSTPNLSYRTILIIEQISSAKNNYRLAYEKSYNEIHYNRSMLTSRIRLLSKKNSLIADEAEQEMFNYKEFKYAGSKRFTLSGDPPNSVTEIKLIKSSLMGAIAIATGVALHINQSTAWWDGKGRSFYIYDDWNDALFADKFGHFMGGYFISYLARESFVYSGFSWNQSIFLGSLLGLISQTYIEFKDGHAENTGFSPSDFAADLAGVTYFYVQHYIPFLQNFSPKWQYAPPAIIGVPPKARTQTFLDNYNSTTAWISIHIHNLFLGKEESFWPKWLNLGIGYGINGYNTQDISNRFVIGIDYNLVELLPDGDHFWNWLKQSLNCIKFPAPAIEFSQKGTRFRILYPFTFSIGSIRF